MSDLKRLVTIALLSMLTAIASPSWADTTIVFDDDGEPKPSRIQIKDGMVRMQHADDTASYVIYNSDRNDFTVVMPPQKMFMVMNQAQLAKVKKLQADAIARMEEQLKQLPEGQRDEMRAMMSQMMPQLSGDQPLPVRSYKETGQTANVNGYPCRIVHVYRDDVLAGEQCVSPPADLGISDSDFESLTAMFLFMSDIAAQFSGSVHSMSDIYMALDQGIPVRYKTMHSDQQRSGSLREINNEPLTDALFEIPSDYTAQEIPDQLGGF